jgi:hypothetical protein
MTGNEFCDVTVIAPHYVGDHAPEQARVEKDLKVRCSFNCPSSFMNMENVSYEYSTFVCTTHTYLLVWKINVPTE